MQRRLEESERSNAVKDVNAIETRGRRKESTWRAEAKKILDKKTYEYPGLPPKQRINNESNFSSIAEEGDVHEDEDGENMFKTWAVTG